MRAKWLYVKWLVFFGLCAMGSKDGSLLQGRNMRQLCSFALVGFSVWWHLFIHPGARQGHWRSKQTPPTLSTSPDQPNTRQGRTDALERACISPWRRHKPSTHSHKTATSPIDSQPGSLTVSDSGGRIRCPRKWQNGPQTLRAIRTFCSAHLQAAEGQMYQWL